MSAQVDGNTLLDRKLLRRTIALQVAQAHQDNCNRPLEHLLEQAAEIEQWLNRS